MTNESRFSGTLARAAAFTAALLGLLAVAVGLTLTLAPDTALAQSNPPATPSSVTLTRADGTVTADWPAPDGATKYHVTYSTDGGGSWHAPVNDHTNVTTSSLTFSADNGKSYIVGVRAGNDNGQWSGWRNSPQAGPYTPPNSSPPDAVDGVSISRADGTITASWNAPDGADKYHVTYTDDGGQSWHAPVNDNANVATTSITFSGDNAKTYTVGVRAGNDHGWSGWRNSPASGPYTPPTRGISVQDSNGNAITSLSIPEGGEASYYVKLTAAPTEETKVCVYLSVRDKNDPDITFKGEAADVVSIDVVFTPDNWDTAQTVTLVAAEDDDAVNGARDSGLDARTYYSGYVTLPVTEVDNDAPAAPSSVTVTRADGTVTASWPAVSGATKYHITYSSDNKQSWTAASDNHTGNSITISNADNSKTYVVAVRAGNAAGWSGWTNSAPAGPFEP